MAYIVKDVTLSEGLTPEGKENRTCTVELEATNGATTDLLKGVSNERTVYVTVPYKNAAQVLKDVKARIQQLREWRTEEMELFNQLHSRAIEG